jgi:small subunit ribosomal protein S15
MSDYLNKEKVGKIFEKFAGSAQNTGSVEGQVAYFTYRISHMSDHLKVNPKDNDTRRSLIALVGKRKDLLKYLSRKDLNKYRKLIAELGLRDTQK